MNNKYLYFILSIILLALLGSSVYLNFIAKSANVVSFILLLQIIFGIISSIVTLFLCKGKRNHKVLLIAFLQIMFSVGLVSLNTVYGYKNVIDASNYIEYMEYISMYAYIYAFIIFGLVLGVFTLDQYVKNYNKISNN